MTLHSSASALAPKHALLVAAVLSALAQGQEPAARRGQLTAADVEGWQSVELIAQGPLVVRIRVRREASLADLSWMAFELENRGDVPLDLQGVSYQIRNAEQRDAASGELIGSGSLASSCGLFNQMGPLPPGIHRFARELSLYSAALLAHPALGTGARAVRAQVHIAGRCAGLGDVGSRSQPAGEVAFHWNPLRDSELAAARNHARQLVADPDRAIESQIVSCYYLGALLGVDEIAASITAAEVLAGLRACGDRCASRGTLMGFLAQRHGSDPAVVARFRAGLDAPIDRQVLTDVARHPGLWSATFVEPLVRAVEADAGRAAPPPQTKWLATRVLFERGATVRGGVTSRRLAEALRAQFATLLQDPDNRDWGALVTALGHTRDPRLVEVLAPMLAPREGDEANVPEQLPPFSVPSDAMLPRRPKDFALEAIVTILDGDPHALYDLRPNDAFRWPGITPRAMAAMRDAAIVAVLARIGK